MQVLVVNLCREQDQLWWGFMRCQVKKTFKVRGQISRAGWESAWHLRDILKLNAPSISHCYHGNTMTCGLVPFGYSPNTSFFWGFVLWILVLNIVVSHWSVVFYLVDTSLMHSCFTMTCGFVPFGYSSYAFLFYNDIWFCTLNKPTCFIHCCSTMICGFVLLIITLCSLASSWTFHNMSFFVYNINNCICIVCSTKWNIVITTILYT